MADVGKDPIPEFKNQLNFQNFKNGILWASIREPYNIYKPKDLSHIIICSSSYNTKIENLENHLIILLKIK